MEVTAEVGSRFALLAGGILSGIADALTQPRQEPAGPVAPRHAASGVQHDAGPPASARDQHRADPPRAGRRGATASASPACSNVPGSSCNGVPRPNRRNANPPNASGSRFEELGPTFIKLGQVLATRVDLLPPDWIAEFERLHRGVSPVPFEDLLPDVKAALGRSPFDVFADLDTRAHGSASIAQVHCAKLKDGTPVVLKIRRPGIETKVAADLRLLGHLATLIESEMPEARRYQPAAIVAHFTRSIERELDFTIEANNVERFAKQFADDPFIVIPRVYPEWTSETLLVQEHVGGHPGNRPRGGRGRGARQARARRARRRGDPAA